VFCSSAVGFSKPSREFFLFVQRKLGVEPNRILLVGDDRKADYEGALAAGWRAALLDRRGSEFGGSCIRTLAALFEWLPAAPGPTRLPDLPPGT
jgi:putative hydrolase of the HAD superfamily